MIKRNLQIKLIRRFDDSSSETRSYMPLNMAMEKLNTGVIGFEADDDVAAWSDADGVASHGDWREVGAGVADSLLEDAAV